MELLLFYLHRLWTLIDRHYVVY